MNKFKVYSDVEPSVPAQGIGVRTERKALGVLNKGLTENVIKGNIFDELIINLLYSFHKVQGAKNAFQKKHKKEKKSGCQKLIISFINKILIL